MRLGNTFGQFLTDTVRELAYQDGQQEKAVLMLVDSLGMSVPQAEEVICGKIKLCTSEDGVQVETVDDNWVPPDLKKMDEYVGEVLEAVFGGWTNENRHKSMVIFMSNLSDIVKAPWRDKAREISEWRKVNIVKAYKKAEALYQDMHKLKSRPGYDPGGSTSIAEQIEAPIIASIASSSLDDEEKVKLIRTAKGIDDAIFKGVNVVIDLMFKFDTGWLNIDGIYYGCEPGQHIALSEGILSDFFPRANINKAQEYLEEHGWAKCSDSKWYYSGNGLSPKQISTIKGWTEKWGEPLSWNAHECTLSEIMRKRGKIR